MMIYQNSRSAVIDTRVWGRQLLYETTFEKLLEIIQELPDCLIFNNVLRKILTHY
jgi:hypothetical protein